ncbi:S1C family serine protease [Bifidobacterium eulemuris]|uniref:Peptidase n=1 Tax=Bifidobacterium eulemuris TaxID=1765219 RepID=A0A261GE27_9BIFI|nr:trypsin-like peptidase domain-containing protein [Bifidobacterium eulemuris]OZG69667.1 peptidase [Bifidobacterium eulemuris]QOL32224.1 trypsin-like peptidase domain-containing protein [Bifidobacterium eulemuris]
MAEENERWNAGAGASDGQQTPNENAAPQNEQHEQHEATVSIDPVENTVPMGTPVAADQTQDTTVASDTPDYAAAAGEQTVVSSAPTTNTAAQGASAQQQYRPAPEYGAYGPTPTQSAATGQQGAPANGQAQQNGAPTSIFGFGQPQQNGAQGNRNPYTNAGNGNPFFNPQAQQSATPAGGAVPPQQGMPQNAAQPGGSRPHASSGTVKSVTIAVISALLAAALCLGLGFAAITNGWVTVPTSNSLSNVSSNKSGSGSATAKTGEATDWKAVASEVSDSVVAIQVATENGSAQGSGAILDSEGNIVTNNHVVSGAQQIQVTLASGAIYSATLVGSDTTTDLAVIKLDNPPSDLKGVEFADSDQLAVGEDVMAIGNPLGYDDTATTGIVSALNRPVSVMDDETNSQIVTNAVQLDAAINPGNSGGPTFNAAGQVIGINSSIATASSSSSSAGSIGIGFAIPSNLVKRVTEEILETGSVTHVALGVTIASSTVEADGVTRGCALIKSSTGRSAVVSGGPADQAGLQEGDAIVAYNGNAVNNMYSLLGYVRAAAMGDEVTLTIVRNGNTMDVNVTLDQEEDTVTGSNRSESDSQSNQNDQDSQDGQSDGNSDSDGYGYDGLTDPFGLW